MNIGKLYQIKQYFWMLYPSKEIAASALAAEPEARILCVASTWLPAATEASHYWSRELNCNVSYISLETIFFPVEVNGNYVKVVSGEGVGWIIVQDWAKECFEEVTQ